MIYLVESNNKEKRKQRGVRFPISLLGKIEDVMKSEKSDNFSAIVVSLCWKGIDRYYSEKITIENTFSDKKEDYLAGQSKKDQKEKIKQSSK